MNIKCEEFRTYYNNGDIIIDVEPNDLKSIIYQILNKESDWIKDYMLDSISKKYVMSYFDLIENED